MDNQEARELLREHLSPWRNRTYAELAKAIGESHEFAVTSRTGRSYQVDIQVFWDHRTGGNIRVIGAIDDGGLRAFMPLADSFIVSPDGTFVGE